MPETTLTIPAIHCEHCVQSIEKALAALPGTEVTAADPATKQVHVRFDASVVSLEQIREALDQIGFSPAEETEQ